MVSKKARDAVAHHYELNHGTGEDMIAAFVTAREEYLHEDIEWIEPFGTIHGAEQVQQALIGVHTKAFKAMYFRAEESYPVGGEGILTRGASGGTFLNGKSFEGRFIHVYNFDGDRAIRFQSFNEDGVIQRALGLPEDAAVSEIMAAMFPQPTQSG